MKIRFFLFILMLGISVAVFADKPEESDESVEPFELVIKTKKFENIHVLYYAQLTGGGNFNVNENLRKSSFGKALGYDVEALVGLELTPQWSIDLRFAYNNNVHMYGEKYDEENISRFHSYDLFFNAGYNLMRRIVTDVSTTKTVDYGNSRYSYNRRHNLYVNFGIGTALSSGLTQSGYANGMSFGFDAGLTYTCFFTNRWAFVANGMIYAFTDKYNYIANGLPLDIRLNLNVGVRYSIWR